MVLLLGCYARTRDGGKLNAFVAAEETPAMGNEGAKAGRQRPDFALTEVLPILIDSGYKGTSLTAFHLALPFSDT